MWIAAKEGEKVRLKGQLVQLRGRRILYVAPADPGPFGILAHVFLAVRAVNDGVEIRFLDSSWLRDRVRQSTSFAHFTYDGEPVITVSPSRLQAFLLKFRLYDEALDDPLLLRRLNRLRVDKLKHSGCFSI